MLTPRNVILVALAVVLFWLTWEVIGLLGEPDSNGAAADSYGTRNEGQRGLYETMSVLGFPVSRSLEPPGSGAPMDTTIVLWKPDGQLVSFEPRFLNELGDWVERGGRVVVSPPEDADLELLMLSDDELPVKDATTTLWDALNLDKHSVSNPLSSLKASTKQPSAAVTPEVTDDSEHPEPQLLLVDVTPSGDLASLASEVHQLAAPADGTSTLMADDAAATGAIECLDSEGVKRNAVLQFAVGKGTVVVVGDSKLFTNRFLANADNSVLAVRLLLGDRDKVQFNEFYHGLSVRGNALWLLTRRGYALLAAAVVLAVVIVVWRSGVLLGPPLISPEPSRRTITEYVDAMSRFLNRGRKTRAPLLQAVYSGTLRRIAAEHGLALVREDAAVIANAVARRNHERADRLRGAAAAVDAVLAKHDKASEKETIRAFRQLQDCLESGPHESRNN